MERIEIAKLNIDEVLSINSINAKEALRRAGGRILFITDGEYEDGKLTDTCLLDLPILSLEDCRNSMYTGSLLAAELKDGRDYIHLLVEEAESGEWTWAGLYDVGVYEQVLVYSDIISKYNERFEC